MVTVFVAGGMAFFWRTSTSAKYVVKSREDLPTRTDAAAARNLVEEPLHRGRPSENRAGAIVVDDPAPNASPTGETEARHAGRTTGLLDTVNRVELEGVIPRALAAEDYDILVTTITILTIQVLLAELGLGYAFWGGMDNRPRTTVRAMAVSVRSSPSRWRCWSSRR